MPDSQPRAATLLWNVKSGWEGGEQKAEQVREILSGLDPNLRFRQIERGSDIVETARNSIRGGSGLLIAAGGDGTINAVASVLVRQPAHSPVTLGVIPAGTLNHFARDLGIVVDPVEAARQLRHGREMTVDLGEVNGRTFVNNSVLGLYPVYRTARRAIESHGFGSHPVGRFFAVLGGILRVFWRLPHLRLRLVTETGVHELQSPFILIANNEHELEKGRIGKRTALNSGHLWVYVMRRCSRWAVLRYFFRFIFGRFSRHEVFDEFEVQHLRIETRRKRVAVSLDGEIVHMRSPLEYRSLPQALRVIAPDDCPLTP